MNDALECAVKIMSDAWKRILGSGCVLQYSKKCWISFSVVSVAFDCLEDRELNALDVVKSKARDRYKKEPIIFCIFLILSGFNLFVSWTSIGFCVFGLLVSVGKGPFFVVLF